MISQVNLSEERMKGFGAYEVDGMIVNYLYGLNDLCQRYLTKEGMENPTILELGTNDGVSTMLFAKYGIVTTVDVVYKQSTKQKFECSENPIEYVNEYFHKFSEVCKLSGKKYDLIYIDGEHTYSAVRADISMFIGFVNDGGIIAGHDYNQKTSGVISAVNELADRIKKDVNVFSDSSWAIEL